MLPSLVGEGAIMRSAADPAVSETAVRMPIGSDRRGRFPHNSGLCIKREDAGLVGRAHLGPEEGVLELVLLGEAHLREPTAPAVAWGLPGLAVTLPVVDPSDQASHASLSASSVVRPAAGTSARKAEVINRLKASIFP